MQKNCNVLKHKQDRPEDNAILEEVIKKITKCQKTLKSGYLENLTVETYEDLVIVISAIQRNLDECLEIRQEIEMIVEEVHKKKHDHVPTAYRKTLSLENQLKNELATGDILSTLINFEKAHILDTSTDSPHLDRGMIFHAAKQMETSSQADLTLSATGNSKSSVRSTEDK
ncbi:cation channel sperm-associated protein 4-like [Myxocyprinus asiaticus]|uniref:cation channel sperm-associated protein 4-like n=1 Tax=Myxocyprinus asiaticus TaxID=70543 RepID=UPI0022228727|nr:cation channel sperm-associated protein 4-like [Myxocyprinus asiaticus]